MTLTVPTAMPCVSAVLSVFLICVVNGHVIYNSNDHNPSNTSVYNSTDGDVDSNYTDVVNSTISETPAVQENQVFRLRERLHSRNRRFRLRWVRAQILRTLGWTEPPRIPEDLRIQILNDTFPNDPPERPTYSEDRRCFSASCSLPRQIDRHLWEDESLNGFRVYTGMLSRHDVSPASLQSATLNVFLTHTEGLTCHGEEVPVSRTGSRFFVSVKQFIRPLRFQRSRNRVLNRKRLIDVRMVTTSGHTRVTFDVREVVLEWVRGERNNFGFEIIVKDENETECNAMNMFVPPDCNSPEEIGCREDSSGPANPLPWFRSNSEDNYPYLEIVTRHLNSRGRPRRDVSVTSSLSTYVDPLPSRGNTVGICQGREVRVHIADTNVIVPRYVTTLVCEGTCATAHNGMLQIVSYFCRATEQLQVKGLYFDENNNVRFGPLPYTQILQCGC